MRTNPLGPATAALIILAGCAGERQAPTAGGSAGAQPGLVRGTVTSDLAYRPLPAERLSDPGVRARIEECERAARQHCREFAEPVDQRQSFRKGVDAKVVAVLQLGRLPAGTTLERVCRFIDPGGSMVTTLRSPVTVPPSMPPDMTLSSSCVMNLGPGTREGTWTVEFEVNGERASVLHFEVLAGPGAGSA